MTNKKDRPAAILRLAIAASLIIQLVLLVRDVLTGARVANVVSLITAVLAVVAVLLSVTRRKLRALEIVVVVIALALTARFQLVPYLQRNKWPGQPRLAATGAPKLVSFLRNLSAAQEQYRLRSGRYSDSMDSLRKWTEQPAGSTVRLVAREDMAWSAQTSLAGTTCSIWARDSALRMDPGQSEGHPTCGTRERRGENERVPTVVAAPSRDLRAFVDADITGSWMQHRSDARRTGVSTDGGGAYGHSWTTRVSGPVRAPVSIAGNQVFVGAHGNGELVALTLDSGRLGFRLRAPNWVHHEPAVSNELIIVGFGNNELVKANVVGSDPSGVVAYDRRTGFERWRFNTEESVMGVPIISDSVVVVSTGGPEVVGMRLRDGKKLWRTEVADGAPMGNPLLIDNLMIFGVETTSACAIDVHTGSIRYCIPLVDKCGVCWGAGHSSPALAGDLVLQIFESDTMNSFEVMISLLKRMVGFPRVELAAETGEQILVAFDWRDGRVRWRTSLGRGSLFPPGHIAGTPVVVDNVAFIPAANNGHVVAVNTGTGRVLWSSPVGSSRGSVTVTRGSVFVATRDTAFAVLETSSGRVKCRQRLPARADRAGLTIAGETGILALGNGTIMARPLGDWLACRS